MDAPVHAAPPSAGKSDRRRRAAAGTHGRAPHGVHGRCVRRLRRWHRPGTSIPIVLPIAAGLHGPGVCRGQSSKPLAHATCVRGTCMRAGAACPGIRVELRGPRPGARQHVGVDHRLPNGSGMDERSCACVTAAHAPSQDAWPCHFASVLPVTWPSDPCHRAVQQNPPESANRVTVVGNVRALDPGRPGDRDCGNSRDAALQQRNGISGRPGVAGANAMGPARCGRGPSPVNVTRVPGCPFGQRPAVQPRKPRRDCAKFSMPGKMAEASAAGRPNHCASVEPIWFTDMVGTMRPRPTACAPSSSSSG